MLTNYYSIHDGLGLTFAIGHGTDPANADTDGDGLLDGEEVNTLGTNPASADTDGDGLEDGEEVLHCLNVAPPQTFSFHVLTNLTEASCRWTSATALAAPRSSRC